MGSILSALAVLAFGVGAAGSAAPLRPATVPLPSPAVWLAADGPQVYVLTAQGDLLGLQGSSFKTLARAFSAQVITACAGRVVGVTETGKLQVWTERGVWAAPDADLSPLAHPVCLPLGAVLVAQTGDLRRYEPVGSGWRQTAHTAAQALPDAQLTLADLDGTGDAQVVALTHPDQRRYDHGILGDATEATEITVFERHSLGVLSRVTLPAPFVFEDLQARPVRLEGGRDGLIVVRSSAAGGAALALVQGGGPQLTIQATSPDFGQTHRWLSPLVGSGQLWAILTPHIGGHLTQYAVSGNTLKAVNRQDDVSSHSIGSRNLGAAVVLGPGRVIVPTQDHRTLLLLDCQPACRTSARFPLAAPYSSNVLLVGPDLWIGDEAGKLYRWAMK